MMDETDGGGAAVVKTKEQKNNMKRKTQPRMNSSPPNPERIISPNPPTWFSPIRRLPRRVVWLTD